MVSPDGPLVVETDPKPFEGPTVGGEEFVNGKGVTSLAPLGFVDDIVENDPETGTVGEPSTLNGVLVVLVPESDEVGNGNRVVSLAINEVFVGPTVGIEELVKGNGVISLALTNEPGPEVAVSPTELFVGLTAGSEELVNENGAVPLGPTEVRLLVGIDIGIEIDSGPDEPLAIGDMFVGLTARAVEFVRGNGLIPPGPRVPVMLAGTGPIVGADEFVKGNGMVSLALIEMPVVIGTKVGEPVGGGSVENPVPRIELVDSVGPGLVSVELERGYGPVLLGTLPLKPPVLRTEKELLVVLPLILVTKLVLVNDSCELGVIKPDVGRLEVPPIPVDDNVRVLVPSVELAGGNGAVELVPESGDVVKGGDVTLESPFDSDATIVDVVPVPDPVADARVPGIVEFPKMVKGEVLPPEAVDVTLPSPEASIEAVELGPAVEFVKGYGTEPEAVSGLSVPDVKPLGEKVDTVPVREPEVVNMELDVTVLCVTGAVPGAVGWVELPTEYGVDDEMGKTD
ncbi:hypothetical protein HD806DRAFT_531710 [Xylariaceae sp. AK1471]|nr:hypothetical protein HD806DRAFT_531710 [Xylariaceae sp. AK1471]